MKVKELMERCGATDTGRIIAYVKDGLEVRIDRIYGRLEQVDMDLEDGHLSQKRYNYLVARLEKKVGRLEDELDWTEGRIVHLERRIKRNEHRKISKKRMYGGREADDFHGSSYSEDDERDEEDYEDFWEDDDCWIDESLGPRDDDFIDYED